MSYSNISAVSEGAIISLGTLDNAIFRAIACYVIQYDRSIIEEHPTVWAAWDWAKTTTLFSF